MARIEEQVRKIQQELRNDPDLMRSAIAELHRRDAIQVTTGMVVAPVIKDWHDALLETATGKQAVQAKLESELKAQVSKQALEDRLNIADRIRQLKELVHDTFVVLPRSAEPVNGWVPRVRFDLYQNSKDACRKLGQEGGVRYEKALTTIRYAMTGSRSYRDAIEVLGL